ncbi:macrophage mannose receptor 1-like [Mya arenaria]|uniref:macrophage mannose receptor 1-like n=1 Tax=Mya arenaria TaxID=6604 RepID=UPI0022E6E0FD|nr:macrophage mannose receptor 1-like [Mya arenaria]
MNWVQSLPILFAMQGILCDYGCICNYRVELTVYSGMTTSSSTLGSMFEFDCKPLGPEIDDKGWKIIQFEHELGYVQIDPDVQIQTCQGEIPPGDVVVTSQTSSKPVTHTETTTAPIEKTSIAPSTPTPTTTATTTTASTAASQPSSVVTTIMLQSSSAVPTTTISLQPVVGVEYGCKAKHLHHAIVHYGQLFTIDQTCYELVHTQKTWTNAEHDCHHRGGHLVHIENEEQQNKIYDVVNQYHRHAVWIGLNDRQLEEHFQWTSGDALNYTHWFPGRKSPKPDSSHPEDCVAIKLGAHSGQWEDINCQFQHGYVCEYDATLQTPSSTPAPNVAVNSDGNIRLCSRRLNQYAHQHHTTVGEFGKSCYELLHQRITFSQAEVMCKKASGHLVHINDAAEQQYVQSFLHRHSPHTAIWTGFNDRHSEGHFHWTAGDPVSYTNWLTNNTHHNRLDCVILDPTQGGKWHDVSCSSSSLHQGFCEFPTAAAQVASVLVG